MLVTGSLPQRHRASSLTTSMKRQGNVSASLMFFDWGGRMGINIGKQGNKTLLYRESDLYLFGGLGGGGGGD